MRKLLFLLLACLGAAACDDIIFTDGRTIAQGYVTDSLTGQPVPGAKVELFTCSSDLIAFGDRCRTILDSAVTDGNGYYRFRFRDQRRTNFGVKMVAYVGNNCIPLPLYHQSNPGAEIVDEELYLVREGRKNQFNFLVKRFKTVQADLRINTPGYTRVIVGTFYQKLIFDDPAAVHNTSVYLKALPQETLNVRGTMIATDKPEIEFQKTVPPDGADTTRIELSF